MPPLLIPALTSVCPYKHQKPMDTRSSSYRSAAPDTTKRRGSIRPYLDNNSVGSLPTFQRPAAAPTEKTSKLERSNSRNMRSSGNMSSSMEKEFSFDKLNRFRHIPCRIRSQLIKANMMFTPGRGQYASSERNDSTGRFTYGMDHRKSGRQFPIPTDKGVMGFRSVFPLKSIIAAANDLE